MSVTDTFIAITGRLDVPMLLVTTAAGAERAGCLIGFATQASIDPPRFIACLSDKNRTQRVASHAEALAVHFLPAGAVDLARLFGSETGDEVDKFARCRWHPGPHDVPILDECGQWFVGRILERQPLGDHVAFVLDPVEAGDDGQAEHLTLSDVMHLEPGHDA